LRIVEWTDDMALGVDQIDADHADLLKIVQETDRILLTAKAPRNLHTRIVHLFRFADEHFSREDTLMDRLPTTKYGTHVSTHRQMHVAFLTRIAGISNSTTDGCDFTPPAGNTRSLFTDMLLEMVSIDREMVEHLASEGLI
jgi:hemerythrin-like metal-binding protein